MLPFLNAQPLPSPLGEGLGVGSLTKPAASPTNPAESLTQTIFCLIPRYRIKTLMHYPTAKANATVQKDFRKALRSNMTPAEATLWRALKGSKASGLKFRRQQGIGPFILDFYCPKYRIGIELDGASHDNKFEYDAERTAYLHEQGIRVLRFSNQQVFTSMQVVLAEIIRAASGGSDHADLVNDHAGLVSDPTPNPSPTGEGSGCALKNSNI